MWIPQTSSYRRRTLDERYRVPHFSSKLNIVVRKGVSEPATIDHEKASCACLRYGDRSFPRRYVKMTGMVRKALTMAAGLTVVASLASAGVPDPRFSVIDPIGVGDNTGAAVGGSPAGFDVAVKDVNSAPVLGATVTLNFSASGVRGYSSQNAGTTVNAGAQTLSRVATTGSTNFAAKTGKFNNANTVEVSANGVVLGDVK